MAKFFKKVWDNVGFWVLVSPIIVAILASMFFGIVRISNQIKSKDDNVQESYLDGYDNGYNDGIIEGEKTLGGYADYKFDEVCSKNDIEDALAALILYEDGERLTKDEISQAIWTLNSFYEDVCDMVSDIEYYYDK